MTYDSEDHCYTWLSLRTKLDGWNYPVDQQFLWKRLTKRGDYSSFSSSPSLLTSPSSSNCLLLSIPSPLSSVDFVTYREDNSISCSIGSADRQSEISCGIQLPQELFSSSPLSFPRFFAYSCSLFSSFLSLSLCCKLVVTVGLSLSFFTPQLPIFSFCMFCGLHCHALSICSALTFMSLKIGLFWNFFTPVKLKIVDILHRFIDYLKCASRVMKHLPLYIRLYFLSVQSKTINTK